MSDIYGRYYATSQDEHLTLEFEHPGPFAVSMFRNVNKDLSVPPERQLVYHGEHADKATIQVPSEHRSTYEVVVGKPKQGQLTVGASVQSRPRPKDSVKISAAMRSAHVLAAETDDLKNPWPTPDAIGLAKRGLPSDNE